MPDAHDVDSLRWLWYLSGTHSDPRGACEISPMRRLSQEKIEKQLRVELMSRILSPYVDDNHRRIYHAVQKISSDGRVYLLLKVFPEQFEDVFSVLVDDREVVFFELSRDDVFGEPKNFEKIRYETYRRKMRGARNVEEFRIATEIVRAMINAPGE